MIITLISIAVVVIGIVIAILYDKDVIYSDALDYASAVFIALGSISVIVCGLLICFANINADITLESVAEEKAIIEYRLETQDSDDSLTVNGGAYADATAFNKVMREARKWEKNTWVNWFHTQGVADIGLIDITRGD